MTDLKEIPKVIIILQGKEEGFDEYQTRLNNVLSGINTFRPPFVFPSSASDGRLCCIINYSTLISQ